MGTRSFVGMMDGGTCTAVYVHCDGYLEGVGAELRKYNTHPLVSALIQGGDRFSLTDGLYADRGEPWEDVRPRQYSTFNEFLGECHGCWAEWYYIWKDGVWYCGCTKRDSRLRGCLTELGEAFRIWNEECSLEDA